MIRSAGLAPKGFRVDYSNFQSGHLVVEALDAGSLDYGGLSEIPPVFAAASPIRSFRQIAVTHGDVNNQVILVPRGVNRLEEEARIGRAGTLAAPERLYRPDDAD
jgi:sulfonate transport system substrate-binding protein